MITLKEQKKKTDMKRSQPCETAVVTRKLFYLAAGWLCGLSLFLYLSFKIAVTIEIAGIIVSAISYTNKLKPFAYRRFITLVCLGALLGTLYFGAYSLFKYERIIAYDGREAYIRGTITDMDYSGGDRVRITVSGRINHSVHTKITLYAADDDFEYGDGVTFKGKLKVPENTVVFDNEDYSASQGIFLEGGETMECAEHTGCANYAIRLSKKLRGYAIGKIKAVCGSNSGSFITASLCADKQGLSAQTKGSVYRAGLGHLFAVSGTHVVILISFVSLLLDKLICSSRLRSGALIAVIWCFALFAGLSPSVVRACIMASISHTAVFFHRRSDSLNSLGAAAIIITLQCPYSLTSVSFLMSFTAALAAGGVSGAICSGRISGNTMKTLMTCICVNLFTMPLCAEFFSEISCVSAISNLIMIPLCSVMLSLSFLYMLTGCSFTFLIQIADIISTAVLKLCSVVTSADSSYIGTHLSKTLVAAGLFGISAICFVLLIKPRKAGLIICSVYAAVCISTDILGQQAVSDRLIIIPNGSSYTAVIVHERNAQIIDLGNKGKNAYTVNNLLGEYHTKKTAIILNDSSVYSKIRYERRLYDEAVYFSLCDSLEAQEITTLKGVLVIGDMQTSSTENGCEIILEDRKISFKKNEIIIDGNSYKAEGFDKIAVILL